MRIKVFLIEIRNQIDTVTVKCMEALEGLLTSSLLTSNFDISNFRSKKLEESSRKLEVGTWKLEVGIRKLEVRSTK